MKTKCHSTLSAPDTKRGGQTHNSSIRCKWSALGLGGFLFTSIFALSAAPVAAQCQQYAVSGQWTILQGSFTVPVTLSQNGKTVSGTAFHQSHKAVHGRVTGTIEGDSFDVQINWDGGGAGVYRGTIGQNGVIRGTTYDKNKPSSTATWSSDRGMHCADAATVQPNNPTRKVIKSTGRARVPAATPAPAAPPATNPSTAPPFIRANPSKFVTAPAGTQGTTTLTWDGGKDHPYAEVWLQVGDGLGQAYEDQDKTFVVEQGKGTRQITVERGKSYNYILTDAGQQLQNVVIRVVN